MNRTYVQLGALEAHLDTSDEQEDSTVRLRIDRDALEIAYSNFSEALDYLQHHCASGEVLRTSLIGTGMRVLDIRSDARNEVILVSALWVSAPLPNDSNRFLHDPLPDLTDRSALLTLPSSRRAARSVHRGESTESQ